MTVCELLDKKSKWAKGWLAYNNLGRTTPVDSEDAVSWCLLGALVKCYKGYDYNKKKALLGQTLLELHPKYKNVYSEEGCGPAIASFNDGATFEEVRAVIEEAGV